MVLRFHGVLDYDQELAEAVDNFKPIEPGSDWELGIRWATVFAAEQLRVALTELGKNVPTPALDYALWHDAVLGPGCRRHGRPPSNRHDGVLVGRLFGLAEVVGGQEAEVGG